MIHAGNARAVAVPFSSEIPSTPVVSTRSGPISKKPRAASPCCLEPMAIQAWSASAPYFPQYRRGCALKICNPLISRNDRHSTLSQWVMRTVSPCRRMSWRRAGRACAKAWGVEGRCMAVALTWLRPTGACGSPRPAAPTRSRTAPSTPAAWRAPQATPAPAPRAAWPAGALGFRRCRAPAAGSS